MSPENLQRHFAWIKSKKPEDWMGEAPPPPPCDKPPGSWSKVLEMAERYERREAIFSPADEPENPRTAFVPATLGSEMDHRLAMLFEQPGGGMEEVERRTLQAPRPRRPCELRESTPEERRKECERKRLANLRKKGLAAFVREPKTGQLYLFGEVVPAGRRRRFGLAIRVTGWRRVRGTWEDLFLIEAPALYREPKRMMA